MAGVCELKANSNILSKDRITSKVCGRLYEARLRTSINRIKKQKKKNSTETSKQKFSTTLLKAI